MGTSGEGEATGGRAVSTQREVVLGTQQATPKVGWFVSSGAEVETFDSARRTHIS